MKRLIVFLLLIPCMVFASNESQDKRVTWEADITAGAMFIDSADNLNPKSSDERIDNLHSRPKAQSNLAPIILPDVTLRFNHGGKLSFYLGTGGDGGTGTVNMALGIRYPLSTVGILDLSGSYIPFGKAWENPYQTGVDREETDEVRYGGRLALNRVLGTGLQVSFSYTRDNVHNDVIGRIFSELRRDGNIYSLNTNYNIVLNPSFSILPGLNVIRGDYDGSSNSYYKLRADLGLRYRLRENLYVMPRIFYSYSKYDEIHPLFGQRRDENGYGVNLVTEYRTPFGLQHYSIKAIVGMSRGDSNMSFFDNRSVSGGLALTYKF